MRIVDVEGIGPAYAQKLASVGIRTTDALLKKGASPAGRQELEAASGISHSLILEWVNLADLYRVKGVGSEYSDLLEEAGVDSVAELSKRVAQNLLQKMTEVNNTKKIVRKIPGVKQVDGWIREAKKLPRVVTY